MSIQRSESVWLILVLLAETVHFSKEYRWHHCIYTAALVDRAMTTRITEHSGLKRTNSDLIKSFYVRAGGIYVPIAPIPPSNLIPQLGEILQKREETYWQGAICTSCGATTCLNTLQSTTSFLSSFEHVWIGFDAFVLRNPKLSCATRAPRIATPPPYGYVLVTVYQARGVFGPALILPRQSWLFSGHSSTCFSLGNIKHAPVPQVVTGPCLAKRPQSDSQDPNMACCGQRTKGCRSISG